MSTGQRAQAGERRVAGAEVVERDPHAERAQRGEHGLRGRHLGDQDALGELEHEPPRREAGAPEHVLDDADQLVRAQALAAQVHVHGGVGRVAVLLAPTRPPSRHACSSTARSMPGIVPVASAAGTNVDGREQAVARVVPAHERLGGDDLAGADGDDRLVVGDELAGVQRGEELVARRRLGQRVRVHVRRERAHLALAGLLRAVHRDVGVAHQVVGVHAGAGARGGDADRRAHPARLAGDRDGLGEQRDDPVRDLLAVALVGVLEQDRELVAAQPRGQVGRPHAAADPLGGGHQHGVAGGVAGVVVDALEVVEVEEEHGAGAVRRGRATRARGA